MAKTDAQVAQLELEIIGINKSRVEVVRASVAKWYEYSGLKGKVNSKPEAATRSLRPSVKCRLCSSRTDKFDNPDPSDLAKAHQLRSG
jgi:hypothetical protein